MPSDTWSFPLWSDAIFMFFSSLTLIFSKNQYLHLCLVWKILILLKTALDGKGSFCRCFLQKGSVTLRELRVIAFNSHYGGNMNFKRRFPWELTRRQCCQLYMKRYFGTVLKRLLVPSCINGQVFTVLLHFLIVLLLAKADG